MSGPPVKRVRFASSHVVVSEEEPEAPQSRAVDSDDDDGGTDQAGHLTEDNIEGQEEATIANDDGIPITPFNLREEMQEGYFDSSGCYIFNKEEKDVHDNWLDNVDWQSVRQQKQPTSAPEPGDSDGDSSGSGEDLGPAELARICSATRAFLASPGETVAGAIKRLGGGANRALTASQKLRLRKAGGAAAVQDAEAAATNRRRMLELSDLAGRLVTAGHMTAYQMDSQQLARLGGVGDAESKAGMGAAGASSAGMDMFASDEDEPAEKRDQENKDSTSAAGTRDAGVSWFYRVADDPSAEVHGPFTSAQMLDWSQSDCGWPGGHRVVFVRKLGTPEEAPYYSSARIDFDLYV